MAKVLVADIIIPSKFEGYAIERTATLSAFVQSGIVVRNGLLDGLAAGGGQTVNLPFFKDITAARQLLSDSASLTPNKITTAADIARICNDAQTWAANHLAEALSGEDPLNAILELVGDYWARTNQAIVVSCLKGMFATGGTLTATNKLAIASESIAGQSASTRLTGSTFVDATAKLGDASSKLSVVAMHSATEAALRKADLIADVPASDGKGMLKMFQGRTVVVDDGLPTRAGTTDGTVYTTFLFGKGAFGQGVAPLSSEPLLGGHGTKGLEFYRDPLASDSGFINRRRYILHPRGVKFNSATCVGDSPTDPELATANNWTRVGEAKNILLVAVDHNN